MSRYLFFSHDGFGLGHVRRNTLIARAVLAREPDASIVLVTGVARRMNWIGDDPRVEVVRVPPLLKDSSGSYRSTGVPFEQALGTRASRFLEQIVVSPPDVVIVDRHPYGTAGELLPGLRAAHDVGSKLVLGLRDVLDEPDVVVEETAGHGWEGVAELYHRTLVYGAAHVVDHVAEYRLPVEPHYCGWVVQPVSPIRPEQSLLAIAAGGGGDGNPVFRLGSDLVRLRADWRGVLAPGPYADRPADIDARSDGRLLVLDDPSSCGELFARAAAVLCMAGYNSTVEALAAGRRPILMPRRSPRREQAIRASRLASLGLADVVDEGAAAGEVAWLLDRDRDLTPGELDRAGIALSGADTAATLLVELARERSRR